MSSVPAKIGRYPVQRELGRGAMGIVYLAHDSRLKRAVAIKLLPKTFAEDRIRLDRFEREARAIAGVNHPNIATIYSLEETEDGSCFLVLELVEGHSLAEHLKVGPPPLEEALRIVTQIADAKRTGKRRWM